MPCKFSFWNYDPLRLQVLFNQFKYFFNLYFLLLACSQFVNELRLGALYTYWVPLVSRDLICLWCLLFIIYFILWFIIYFCLWNSCIPMKHIQCFCSVQGFVLIITIVREAVEEIRCSLRDKEVNSQIYSKLCTRGELLLSLECHAAGWALAVFVSENGFLVVNVHV